MVANVGAIVAHPAMGVMASTTHSWGARPYARLASPSPFPRQNAKRVVRCVRALVRISGSAKQYWRAVRPGFGVHREGGCPLREHFAGRRGTPSASPFEMFLAETRVPGDARLSRVSMARAARLARGTRLVPHVVRAASSSAPTTGKHRRKRAPKAIVLRRGHFKRLDEVERPPWPIRMEAEVYEMGMEEHDALNPERRRRTFTNVVTCTTTLIPRRDEKDARSETRDANSGNYSDENLETQTKDANANPNGAPNGAGVVFRALVSPIGASGFFVEGAVRATMRVACDSCGVACWSSARSPVKAWLDENAEEDDASGDWDVVRFPRTADECDLTPLLRDTLRMNAPYETLCAECEAFLSAASSGTGSSKNNTGDARMFSLEPED